MKSIVFCALVGLGEAFLFSPRGVKVASMALKDAPISEREDMVRAKKILLGGDASAVKKLEAKVLTPVIEAPKPAMPVATAVERFTPEEVDGARRKGQNSFADVDTTIFARNPVLDEVALAGDFGFDPFTLSSDKSTLLSYRGAELRHARLAMLAAIGWPLSELLQPKVADSLGLATNGLAKQTLAPSVLNGGLGNISPVFWAVVMAGAASLELQSLDREKEGKFPGDLGFDPMGLASTQMANAEIMNGRVAMLAITGFAIQEAIYHLAVVNETPFFFHPTF